MANQNIVLTGGDHGVYLTFVPRQKDANFDMEVSDSMGGGSCYTYLPERPGPLTKYVKGTSKAGDLIREGKVYVTPKGVRIQTGTVLHENGSGRGVAWRLQPVEKFEKILDAEREVQGEKATVAFGIDFRTRARAHANLRRAEDKLSRLINSLSLEELKAYGEYRKTAKAA